MKSTKNIITRLQIFINKCLRKILGIFWPKTISNLDLWKKAEQREVEVEIKQRKWKWIGHTLRKTPEDITRVALEWNPQGNRKRGRPKTTWRRTVLEEAKRLNKTWSELKVECKNRVRWRELVAALWSSGDHEG